MKPVPLVAALRPYRVASRPGEIRLDLRHNEGPPPDPSLVEAWADADAVLRHYPDATRLEAAIAERHGIDPARVVVTAGADDALDRISRAYLGPGRGLVLHEPAFEMTIRYALLTGAAVRGVPWPACAFPVARFVAAAAEASVVVLTSPNNPTGEVIGRDALRAVAAETPHALLVVDAAYEEYAEDDLTATAIAAGALVLRTFSKAWGLAGIRVGYAIGTPEVIDALRVVGAPYPVSAPSLAVAARAYAAGDTSVRPAVARARFLRRAIEAALRDAGFAPADSHANFAFVQGDGVEALAAHLMAAGIAVREFPGRPELVGAARIGLPESDADLAALCATIRGARAAAERKTPGP